MRGRYSRGGQNTQTIYFMARTNGSGAAAIGRSENGILLLAGNIPFFLGEKQLNEFINFDDSRSSVRCVKYSFIARGKQLIIR